MRTEQRMEIERKIVRHLIRTMKKHGWNAIAVDDGGWMGANKDGNRGYGFRIRRR